MHLPHSLVIFASQQKFIISMSEIVNYGIHSSFEIIDPSGEKNTMAKLETSPISHVFFNQFTSEFLQGHCIVWWILAMGLADLLGIVDLHCRKVESTKWLKHKLRSTLGFFF